MIKKCFKNNSIINQEQGNYRYVDLGAHYMGHMVVVAVAF